MRQLPHLPHCGYGPDTTPSKALSQTTLFNQSQTDQRPNKLAAVFAKGIKIYSDKQIKEADRMESQYFQFWNEKAESLRRNPRFQKWSKLSLEGEFLVDT